MPLKSSLVRKRTIVREQQSVEIGPTMLTFTEGKTVEEPLVLQITKPDHCSITETLTVDDLAELVSILGTYQKRALANREALLAAQSAQQV